MTYTMLRYIIIWFILNISNNDCACEDESSRIVSYLNSNFVVYGSNANGKYLKYDNGTLICWKTISVNATCTTSWGNCYESQQIDLGSYPYSYKTGNAPQITLGSRGINAAFEGLVDTSSTAIGKIRMWRPTSATQAGYIDVICIGIWK